MRKCIPWVQSCELVFYATVCRESISAVAQGIIQTALSDCVVMECRPLQQARHLMIVDVFIICNCDSLEKRIIIPKTSLKQHVYFYHNLLLYVLNLVCAKKGMLHCSNWWQYGMHGSFSVPRWEPTRGKSWEHSELLPACNMPNVRHLSFHSHARQHTYAQEHSRHTRELLCTSRKQSPVFKC